jgi:hypothetical protein
MAAIDHHTTEVFAVCADYPRYSVSNMGRVRNDKTMRIMTGSPQFSKRHNRMAGVRVHLHDDMGDHGVYVHRLVALAFLPRIEGADFVDHISRNTLDNNISNLRWATRRQNTLNRPRLRNNTSGYIGVRRNGRNWKAVLGIDGTEIYLGTFQDRETAARVYDIAAWYNGTPEDREFLELNFDDYGFLEEIEE